MGFLLFAEQQASKGWWFDLVDTWGNTASVIGLLITVIAFPVTWGFQAKIRRANLETLRKVALVMLSNALEDLHRDISAAREAGRYNSGRGPSIVVIVLGLMRCGSSATRI
jgi:hypothetical protein